MECERGVCIGRCRVLFQHLEEIKDFRAIIPDKSIFMISKSTKSTKGSTISARAGISPKVLDWLDSYYYFCSRNMR